MHGNWGKGAASHQPGCVSSRTNEWRDRLPSRGPGAHRKARSVRWMRNTDVRVRGPEANGVHSRLSDSRLLVSIDKKWARVSVIPKTLTYTFILIEIGGECLLQLRDLLDRLTPLFGEYLMRFSWAVSLERTRGTPPGANPAAVPWLLASQGHERPPDGWPMELAGDWGVIASEATGQLFRNCIPAPLCQKAY